MPEPSVTYGRLDETLRSLGFASRVVEGKARIYQHEATGAKVILPDASFADEVIPHHVLMVRTVLSEFGIADPLDPILKPQRAS